MDKKAEKAAKAAARAEADKKAKAEKEEKAAKVAAEKQAAADAAAAALAVAKAVISTGKKGIELEEHVNGLSPKPTAATLLSEVLSSTSDDDVQGLKWSMNEAYGAALGALARGDVKDQMNSLYAVQKYCHASKFPKIGAKKTSLIQMIFQVLYKYVNVNM